jgi:hypothetical protein
MPKTTSATSFLPSLNSHLATSHAAPLLERPFLHHRRHWLYEHEHFYFELRLPHKHDRTYQVAAQPGATRGPSPCRKHPPRHRPLTGRRHIQPKHQLHRNGRTGFGQALGTEKWQRSARKWCDGRERGQHSYSRIQRDSRLLLLRTSGPKRTDHDLFFLSFLRLECNAGLHGCVGSGTMDDCIVYPFTRFGAGYNNDNTART